MLGITESTTESPLEFFNQLLFFDGLKLVIGSFHTENTFTKGYKFINEENREFSFTAWVNKDDITDIVDSDKFFKKVLKFNAINSLHLLSEKLEKLQDEEKKLFVVKQLNEINSYLLKIKKTEKIQNEEFIQEELIHLVKEIYFKFNSLQIRHKLFDTIISPRTPANSYFHCKEFPRSFYKKLFDITSNLLLIDDTETSEDDFINILTTNNPLLINSKIQFTKNNYLVSYFLRAIEPFFENLNFTSVESSKCFYNKQNKLLNEGDLSTALSRGKDKNLSDKAAIEETLSLLYN